jgi:hypothetical protein
MFEYLLSCGLVSDTVSSPDRIINWKDVVGSGLSPSGCPISAFASLYAYRTLNRSTSLRISSSSSFLVCVGNNTNNSGIRLLHLFFVLVRMPLVFECS